MNHGIFWLSPTPQPPRIMVRTPSEGGSHGTSTCCRSAEGVFGERGGRTVNDIIVSSGGLCTRFGEETGDDWVRHQRPMSTHEHLVASPKRPDSISSRVRVC